jgi:anti-sigma factor RsiW
MNCGEAKQALMDLVLEEAGSEERKQMEAHLAGCAACRAELVNLKLTRKLLVQGLPQEEMPQRIAFVSGQAAKGGLRGWLWSRAFAIPVGAAAAIAVLACGLALAHARLVIEQGRWELALGYAPAATTRGTRLAQAAQAGMPVPPLTREQAQQLLAAAIGESEQRQEAASAASLEAALSQLDQRQRATLLALADQMKYFEATQNVFYKEASRTRTALELVASRLPAEKGDRP